MTDKEMLAECLDLLEQWLDGDEPRKVTKKMVDLLTARFTRHKPTFKPELTSKYEIAKDCVAAGFKIKDACKTAGITTDQWYRRKRMEETGLDRVDREYY